MVENAHKNAFNTDIKVELDCTTTESERVVQNIVIEHINLNRMKNESNESIQNDFHVEFLDDDGCSVDNELDEHKFIDNDDYQETISDNNEFLDKTEISNDTVLEEVKNENDDSIEGDELICAICNKSFKTKSKLRQHIKRHVSEDSNKPYKCPLCPEKFTKLYQLKEHKKLQNHIETFNCDQCPKIFKTPSTLKTHVKMVHERAFEQICEICAKIFTTKSSMEQHYKSFHLYNQDDAVECQICGSILKNESTLRRHMRRHMESSISCEICGKECPNVNALRMHKKRTHFDEAKFICTVCNKGFKREHMCKEHMAIHTGEVLYKCPYCPLTSNSSASMYAHKKKKHPIERDIENKIRREKRFGGS